jgi:predicted enzyme related to lactoylglutathione lyase
MPTGERSIHAFCWINVLSPDPAGSRDFYSQLLEWEFSEIPGMGFRVLRGGKDIGGLWDHASPSTPPGTPPGIGLMVRVASADRLVEKAAALGAVAKPAFDVMEQGRMAEIVDPTGAALDVWEGRASPGMTADPELHGVPCWYELMTDNPANAIDFYGKLFGWTSQAMPMPGFIYHVMSLSGRPMCGVMPLTPEMAGIPPHWAVYFNVRDVDESVALAEKMGGTIFMPPMDIELAGRMAGIASPQGVHFYVMKPVPPPA